MRSESGPRTAAARRHRTNPLKKGLMSSSMPSTAPAKAACDMETPISGIFINTTKTDRSEQLAPHRMQATTAR